MTSENMIQGDDYSVEYNENTLTVTFTGTMRLRSRTDYAPIDSVLNKAYSDTGDKVLILDFRQLEFLNSSGINTISRFVINARKGAGASLSVLGNPEIYWQQKSLTNLQKLWASLLKRLRAFASLA